MVTDIWTFLTNDTEPPYVDTLNPLNDALVSTTSTLSFHIKDNGAVDLNNTVIYVNGIYYSNTSGWSGVITNSGTQITVSGSLNFNGGNYTGDTTSRTGVSGDYTFVIDPQTNFTDGEAVPVIIYTRDISGNLMERYVYAVTVMGAGCSIPSTFCGSNTTWDSILLKCVGTGGGSTPSTAVSTIYLTIDPITASVVQIDTQSVLVTWHSSIAGTGRVVYGPDSSNEHGVSPSYGYPQSTAEQNDNSVYHAVVINGLQAGKLYYFVPVTRAQGQEVRGPELVMVTKFSTQIIEKTCPLVKPAVKYTQTQATKSGTVKQTTGTVTAPVQGGGGAAKGILEILEIRRITDPQQNLGREIEVSGRAGTSLKLKAFIY